MRRHGFLIRRVSHVGQFIPREASELKIKFINEIIESRKNNYIDYLENEKVINMDETPCYLDMNMDITIDFQGNKNIEIINSGRNNYRISFILEFSGEGSKLPPLVIIKGEQGKTIEKNLNQIYYVKNKDIFVICQPQGWCISEIFE